MQVKAIGHVAIRVKDVEPTLDFYVNKLGFKEMFRLDRDDRLWIVYLRITDSQFLEVFPDATGDRPPGPEAVGYNHLCLEVDDIDRAVADLAAAGVEIVKPKKTGRRRQSPGLDRRPRRSPDRDHADDAGLHAAGSDRAPEGRGRAPDPAIGPFRRRRAASSLPASRKWALSQPGIDRPVRCGTGWRSTRNGTGGRRVR